MRKILLIMLAVVLLGTTIFFLILKTDPDSDFVIEEEEISVESRNFTFIEDDEVELRQQQEAIEEAQEPEYIQKIKSQFKSNQVFYIKEVFPNVVKHLIEGTSWNLDFHTDNPAAWDPFNYSEVLTQNFIEKYKDKAELGILCEYFNSKTAEFGISLEIEDDVFAYVNYFLADGLRTLIFKLDIIFENDRPKINDYHLIYDSTRTDITPIKDITPMIHLAYSQFDIATFKGSDSEIEVNPPKTTESINNLFGNRINKNNLIRFDEWLEDGRSSEFPLNGGTGWVNIDAVVNEDGYETHYRFKVNVTRGENYGLVDAKAKLIKKVKGTKIGQETGEVKTNEAEEN